MQPTLIRIRAQLDDEGIAAVKVLMHHAMESGLRTEAGTERRIPAHHITEVVCEHRGQPVLRAKLTGMVSRDPYIAWRLRGATAGDRIRVSWVDSAGETASEETVVAPPGAAV